LKYVLGIDSGGQKFLARAQDLDGTDLAWLLGPPALHHRLTPEQLQLRVSENIDACLSKFGGKREDCEFLVCGASGLDNASDQSFLDNLYHSLPGFHCRIKCLNDAVIAHQAATGGIGVIVISGTGSVAYGRNQSGMEARCGGWPQVIFGDDGSGTWIACQALKHVSHTFDGRQPPSLLSEKIRRILDIRSEVDLINVCKEMEQMKWVNPGLGAEVDSAAEENDPHAIQILKDAASCTFALADSLVKRLNFNNESPFKVGAWGSALVKSPLHFMHFKQLFAANHPAAQVLIPDKDAAHGACEMARRFLLDA
jgi:N-acetylglucosamine kinase-like BadF-type ATPase